MIVFPRTNVTSGQQQGLVLIIISIRYIIIYSYFDDCVSSYKCDVWPAARPRIRARAAYILPITSTQWNVHSKHWR